MPGLLASINFGRDRAGGCHSRGIATGRQWYDGDLDYDGTVDDDDVTLQGSAASGRRGGGRAG